MHTFVVRTCVFGADTATLADTPGFSANRLRHRLAAAQMTTLDFLDPDENQPYWSSLVLLGDIIDLSLGTPRKSIASLHKLLPALRPLRDRLGPTVFLPGSHNHELWTVTGFNTSGARTRTDAKHSLTARAFVNPD